MKKIEFKDLFTLNKINIIIILTVSLIIISPFAYAKFSSSGKGEVNIAAAFYILKEDYFTENMNIGSLSPRDEPYIYTFTISNFKGKDRLETKMKYNMEIVTTTNLPLTFELYLNKDYTNNIIKDELLEQDSDGMYLKRFQVLDNIMDINQNITNTYELYVKFPKEYTDEKYGDIVDLFEINIDSKQVIDGEL